MRDFSCFSSVCLSLPLLRPLSLFPSFSFCLSIPSFFFMLHSILTIGRFYSVSIVRYHFRPYSYYPHSTLIMFGIEALVPTNSDDVMSSCAMPINFYCTIHLRPTYLQRKQRKSYSSHFHSISFTNHIQIKKMLICAGCSALLFICEHEITFQEAHQRLNGNTTYENYKRLNLNAAHSLL